MPGLFNTFDACPTTTAERRRSEGTMNDGKAKFVNECIYWLDCRPCPPVIGDDGLCQPGDWDPSAAGCDRMVEVLAN